MACHYWTFPLRPTTFRKTVLWIVRMTISLKILHRYSGRQCVTCDPRDFLYPPKWAPFWLFHLHYGQWHDCEQNVSCGEQFTNRHSSLKFSRIWWAWPHGISRYHSLRHASRRTIDSKYAKCAEQLVWTLCNISVMMLYDHIMVFFKSGFKWVFWQHNMARCYWYILGLHKTV